MCRLQRLAGINSRAWRIGTSLLYMITGNTGMNNRQLWVLQFVRLLWLCFHFLTPHGYSMSVGEKMYVLFYPQCIDQLRIRRNITSAVGRVDYHSGLCSIWLFYKSNGRIINRDTLTIPGLRIIGG